MLQCSLGCVTLMLHSPDADPLETRMDIGLLLFDHGVKARHLSTFGTAGLNWQDADIARRSGSMQTEALIRD